MYCVVKYKEKDRATKNVYIYICSIIILSILTEMALNVIIERLPNEEKCEDYTALEKSEKEK